MGSKGGEDGMISGNGTADCSEATVEIKIKTLDSQTYTLRVDKCVPVPALKEQIATVTGVLSEQQRLICRGRVLKDDQLLSAYHVEDGHTLHLVVRQPITPLSDGVPDNSAFDPASSGGLNQVGSSVVVGTFNISERGDGAFPELSRIVSAVLGSFGMANVGGGSEGIEMREHAPESPLRTPSFSGLRTSSRQQTSDVASRGQSDTQNVTAPVSTAVPLESLHPLVIPDSLTTLSQYISRMRQEFSASGPGNGSQAAGSHRTHGQDLDATSRSNVAQGGLPTPEVLAEVLMSAREILSEQAAECLLQLARQIKDHANLSDPLVRMRIQSDSMRTGGILQHFGALLLELGRTSMTLRMGQTPAEAIVNAGPAVFISTSGPNPIMVQPLTFQPGSNFGAASVGTVQPGPVSAGSGFLPRNVDIRIRRGSLIPSPTSNPSEPTAARPPGQADILTSGGGSSANQAAARATGSSYFARESGVRVVPLRTVVAAVPASVRRAASDSSRGSVGLFYPVIARVQHATSEISNSTSGSPVSSEHHTHINSGQQLIPESTIQQQQNSRDRVADGSPAIETGASDSAWNTGTTRSASDAQEAASIASDEGMFLCNLLHQIMPIISQSTTSSLNNPSAEGADASEDTTLQDSSDMGTSSGRRRSPSPASPPSSKRHKGE